MSNKGFEERVLIECGRSKGITKYHHRLIEEWESDFVPRRVSKHIFNDAGWAKDNLGPLYRWLETHLGLPWVQVYSEVTKKLKPNTQSGQHVLGHLLSSVIFNCVFFGDDQTPYYPEHDCPSYSQKYVELRQGEYYIDLEGVLQRTPRKSRKFRAKQAKSVTIGNTTYFYLKDGSGWVGKKWVTAYPRQTGWFVRVIKEDEVVKSKLALSKDNTPIFEFDGLRGLEDRPKLIRSIELVKREVFYLCDKQDLIKLCNHGVDLQGVQV